MKAPEIEVRPLDPADRDPVRELHELCFEEELAFEDIVLDRVFRHANTINLVADAGDQLLGHAAALHGRRPKARLLTIQTHPEARGQGIADSLLRDLEERLRARKAAVLELEVHVDNEPALALYEKRGFEVERENPTAYPSLETSRGYVMQREL